MRRNLILLLLLVVAFASVGIGQAATISGLCITEEQFLNCNAMSLQQIRDFLTAKGGFMKVPFTDADGNLTDALSEIYNAAQANKVNPQFLLAHLQKEMSAVMTPTRLPADDLRSIAGWTYPANTPLNQKSARRQIQEMAAQFKKHYDDLVQCKPTLSGWQVDVIKLSGTPQAGDETDAFGENIAVQPESKVVAALYTYTPWAGLSLGGGHRPFPPRNELVGGNGLFCEVWSKTLGFPAPSGALTVGQTNPTLYCGNTTPRCLSLNVAGGTAPYQWVPNKGTVTPTGNGRNVQLRPPTNSGSTIDGAAYSRAGFNKSCGNLPNICTGGQSTQNCGGGTFARIFGCNDQLRTDNVSLNWVCLDNKAGASAPAQICSDSLGFSRAIRGTCNMNITNCNHGSYTKSYTQICSGTGVELFTDNTDLRTILGIPLSCNPCGVSMQGATVTVRDQNGAGTPVTVNVTVR